MNAMPARGGGGMTYVLEELSGLERALDPGMTMTVLAAPWNVGELRGRLDSPVTEIAVRSVFSRYAFEQVRLPFLSRANDVLYCPLNFGPLLPIPTPVIVTLHNAKYFGAARSKYQAGGGWNARARLIASDLGLRWSTSLQCVSESLLLEVRRDFPQLAIRAFANPSGGPRWPVESSRPTTLVPDRFVLTVGIAPHKRLVDVIRAWAEARERHHSVGDLVIVGGMMPSESVEAHSSAGHGIHQIGYLTDRAELRWLYEHAQAVVCLSEVESFSMVVQEARSLGCPVVASDIPAHREVADESVRFGQVGDWHGASSQIVEVVAGPRVRFGAPPFGWSWDDHASRLLQRLLGVCK